MPSCEVLLAQIKWDLKESDIKKSVHPGGLFLIPVEVQKRVLSIIGVEKYLKLPKPGTKHWKNCIRVIRGKISVKVRYIF